MSNETSARLFRSKNIIEAEYCRDSGEIPTDSCKLDPRLNRINLGYFIKGTEPNAYCELHKTVHINSVTGKIADSDTSYLLRRKIALLDYERQSMHDDINILDNRFTVKARQP